MQASRLQPPIKILLFSANPNATDRLRTDGEFRELRRELRAEEQAGAVVLDLRSAGRTEDLQEALLRFRPHVVHFSGHGTIAEEILLEESQGASRRVSKQALARLFGILKDSIRLVVLNACHSRPLAEAIGEHIEYAVGMDDALTDEAAIHFSVAFYKAIACGNPVQAAFDLGRNALQLKGVEDAEVPVLISRPRADIDPAESPAPVIKGVRAPVQVLFLLDLLSDNPVALDEVEEHVPHQRSERHVLALSQFGARSALRGMGIDFSGCADALTRMVAEARRRLSPNGPPVRYYVAGRAALPVFAHLGMELSSWADVTLINQRKSLEWDVLSLRGKPTGLGGRFFKIFKGLNIGDPSEADGRVAVFISTGHAPKRAEIHAFLAAHNSSIAGFVELRAEHDVHAILDETNVAQARRELTETFEKLPNAYPRQKGIALFVAGPATLAFMAGHSINQHTIDDVWMPNYEGGVYQFAAALPWKRRAQPQVSEEARDELSRKRLLEAILERIEALQRTLKVEHLPPSLSPEEAQKFLGRLQSMRIDKEPRGDDFEFNIVEGKMAFAKGLLEALRTLPEPERARVGQSLFLHELFHFDQNLSSAKYTGVGRAGVALEDVDYWADAMTVATLADWEIRRGGEEGREKAQDIVVACVDALLTGVAAFDRFEQGERIERLYERRLRRYLLWHLQRVRAQSLKSAEDIWALLGKRLIVELAPLRGHLDERFDKVVDAPQENAELFVVLEGRLARSRPVAQGAGEIIEAVRGFDRRLLEKTMRALCEQHPGLLVPWAR